MTAQSGPRFHGNFVASPGAAVQGQGDNAIPLLERWDHLKVTWLPSLHPHPMLRDHR